MCGIKDFFGCSKEGKWVEKKLDRRVKICKGIFGRKICWVEE